MPRRRANDARADSRKSEQPNSQLGHGMAGCRVNVPDDLPRLLKISNRRLSPLNHRGHCADDQCGRIVLSSPACDGERVHGGNALANSPRCFAGAALLNPAQQLKHGRCVDLGYRQSANLWEYVTLQRADHIV